MTILSPSAEKSARPYPRGIWIGSISGRPVKASQTRTMRSADTVATRRPSGLNFTPATCASLGRPGEGAGGLYLTNQRRDYAVVLSPLGGVRVHAWDGSGWTF